MRHFKNLFDWVRRSCLLLKAIFLSRFPKIGFADWLLTLRGRPIKKEVLNEAKARVAEICKFFEIENPQIPATPIFMIKVSSSKFRNYAEYSLPSVLFKSGVIFVYCEFELLETVIHELFHAMTPTFSRLSDYWAETFVELLEQRAKEPDAEIVLPETPEQEYFYVLCCLLADKIKADPSDVTWTMFRRFLKDDFLGLEEFIDKNFKPGTFMLFENEEAQEDADFKRLLQEIAMENNCIPDLEEVKV